MIEKFDESKFGDDPETWSKQRIEVGTLRAPTPADARPRLGTSQRLPRNAGVILCVQVLVDTGEGDPEPFKVTTTGKLVEFLPAGIFRVEDGEFFELRVRITPSGASAFEGEPAT